jgi:hypothetical protein
MAAVGGILEVAAKPRDNNPSNLTIALPGAASFFSAGVLHDRAF